MVVLFAAGNALQVYAIDRTRGAVRALARLAPNEVLVKRGGTEVVVPAGEVGVGDTVVVRPGERLAVDGRVIEGSSAVDEAPVTGESVPVEKGPGDEVYSGSLNGQGGLLVEATKRAGGLDAAKDRTPRRGGPGQQGTRGAVRGPLLAGVHARGGGRGYRLGGRAAPTRRRLQRVVLQGAGATDHRLPVCPGDLHACNRGLRDRGRLQARDTREGRGGAGSGGKLKALAFDKTGTLTEGRPIVSRTVALNGKGEAEVLALAASLERRSEHPLAHAILTAAGGSELRRVSGFKSVAGRGAEGRWMASGT